MGKQRAWRIGRAERRGVSGIGAVKVPLWPLAYELAMMGTPIGAAVILRSRDRGTGSRWFREFLAFPGAALAVDVFDVVVVDADGVMWSLTPDGVEHPGSFCVERHLQWWPSLGALVKAMSDGRCIGWVSGRLVDLNRHLVPVYPWRRAYADEPASHRDADPV